MTKKKPTKRTARSRAKTDTMATPVSKKAGKTGGRTRHKGDTLTEHAAELTVDGGHVRTGPVTDAEVEARIADAADVARLAGILCTGAPEQPECSEPAIVGITHNRRLVALPCRQHLRVLLQGYLGGGNANVTTTSLAYLLDVRGAEFARSAEYIRAFNIENGVHIPVYGEQ